MGSVPDYETIRTYNVYYSAPLIPFAFWAINEAYQRIINFEIAMVKKYFKKAFMAMLLIHPLLEGGFMSYSRPKLDLFKDIDTIIDKFKDHKGVVCVQDVLFPHLPYTWNLKNISASCLNEKNSIGIINLNLSVYPLDASILNGFLKNSKTIYISNLNFIIFKKLDKD
jgi:hypothetical protein